MRKFKDQNMHFNMYQERVIEAGLEKSAKLMKSRISDETSIKKININKLSSTKFRVFIPQVQVLIKSLNY